MRRPTPKDEVYAWWRAALDGAKPAIDMNEPQCGFYQRNLVRGGVMVPVAIWLEQDVDELTGELRRDEQIVCIVAGKKADAWTQWTWVAQNPISEKDYNDLVSKGEYAEAYEPDSPHADPYQTIDLMRTPPVF